MSSRHSPPFRSLFGLALSGVLAFAAACTGDDQSGSGEIVAPIFASDVVGTPNQQLWRQCQNNHDYGDECDWITGNLGSQHNTWAEGDFVPKVLRIPGIQNADPFEVVMTYGFLKGGKTTHDFLGDWNKTQHGANPCVEGNFDSFCTPADATGALNAITATSSSLDMEVLSQSAVEAACGVGSQYAVDMAEAIAEDAGDLVIRGINIADITVTNIVFDGCPVSGDAEAVMTMQITPNGLFAQDVLLLFGAHVGEASHWDNGGAGGVNGSPYHLGLVSVDGTTAGSMDLQMSANAIAPMGSLQLVKVVTNDDGGSATASDFGITTDAGTLGAAVVSGAAPTLTYTYPALSVAAGDYTFGEIDVDGYTEGTWSCSPATATGTAFDAGAVSVASGEDVVCTSTLR